MLSGRSPSETPFLYEKEYSVLTQAQQVIALRDCYALEEHPQDASPSDDRLHHQRIGRIRILTQVHRRLTPIHADMKPEQVEKRVMSLLNWLVGQKICWMSGARRRRTSDHLWKAWQVEGAIEQIDGVIRALSQTFPSRWEYSPARHGYGFQVFHCRDLLAGATGVDLARQRWCGPQRDLWYQEVAIISLKHAEQQLEEIFQLTNHIDHPWPRHREIAWSLDMHALATRLASVSQHPARAILPTGLSYPRSTSVGDVVVSLLSGAAWIVAPFGFQTITEEVSEITSHLPTREDVYGEPIAVMSTYGDTLLDLTHATVAYTLAKAQQISGPNFWVWLRDLDIEQARFALYGDNGAAQREAELAFARDVAEGKWLDPENRDGEALRLLRVGYTGDQEILNESHCTKCLVPLQSLC